MVSKASIINVDQGNEKIEVMFNPQEYELITSAKYSSKNEIGRASCRERV